MYSDLGYRAYKVISVDDLYNPFVSMYFGAAYSAYLSEYEGRSVAISEAIIFTSRKKEVEILERISSFEVCGKLNQ